MVAKGSLTRVFRNSALLWGLFGCLVLPHLSSGLTAATKEKKMTQSVALNPFGLDAKGLKSAKISIALYSTKTGAGRQEIQVYADGEVRVIRTVNYQAPEEILTGKVTQQQAIVLFTLIESEGFLQLQDDYKSGNISSRRQLELTLPSQTKTVWTDYEATPPEFNRIVGAIRAIAGMAVPQTLGRNFLSNL